jgi:hypothetical protein
MDMAQLEQRLTRLEDIEAIKPHGSPIFLGFARFCNPLYFLQLMK